VVHPAEYGLRQWSGWIIGPALLLLTLILDPPSGLSEAGWRTAGAAALMATLWITESIPIPVTALFPLILFPALGLSNIKESATPYGNPLIFLFLGGFLIALAMQKWNLHRRVAINLISAMGTKPRRIAAGFLLASALISMWVSNTATALMMLPIALSVVQFIPAEHRAKGELRGFGIAVLLMVAYGSTIGGMGTLIGTPPNALLAAFTSERYKLEISFRQWMMIGIPIALLAIPVAHFVVTRFAFKLSGREIPGLGDVIRQEKQKLGRMGRGEIAVAIVFTLTALAWITQPLIADVIPLVSDTTIALVGAIALFMIPVNAREGRFVMDWDAAKGIPWDVLILFGGGLSLAAQIEKAGLSEWMGGLFGGLSHLPVVLTVAILCFAIIMLGELTSNTATAAAFLPVCASIATSLGQNPLLFLVPTAFAASCSFMLPVGTPPNAIVFGSGMIRLPEMARTGFLLNVLMVPIIVGVLWLLGPIAFDIDLGSLPAWAK
jgi:sodium-dependent dicarboxylate transporter 2/3/5